jgi:hypothetical protein
VLVDLVHRGGAAVDVRLVLAGLVFVGLVHRGGAAIDVRLVLAGLVLVGLVHRGGAAVDVRLVLVGPWARCWPSARYSVHPWFAIGKSSQGISHP